MIRDFFVFIKKMEYIFTGSISLKTFNFFCLNLIIETYKTDMLIVYTCKKIKNDPQLNHPNYSKAMRDSEKRITRSDSAPKTIYVLIPLTLTSEISVFYILYRNQNISQFSI